MSLVPVTGLEINANIHKDAAQGFFSKNRFVSLRDNEVHDGLSHAGERYLDNAGLVQCLRFAQKKRNEFVGVTADGRGGMPPFDVGGDPAPKDVMRHAAMAAALVEYVEELGAEYDTQKGLDFLSHELYALRHSGEVYARLHTALSVRRLARCEPRPLTASEQMLLAEIIRDKAVEAYRASQPKLPSLAGRQSTVEFADRFAQAFPGVRGIAWFADPSDMRRRLETLLHEPLTYSDATPIWWFEGLGNLQKKISLWWNRAFSYEL